MDVAQKTKKQDKNENLLIDKNCFLRINPKLRCCLKMTFYSQNEATPLFWDVFC